MNYSDEKIQLVSRMRVCGMMSMGWCRGTAVVLQNIVCHSMRAVDSVAFGQQGVGSRRFVRAAEY